VLCSLQKYGGNGPATAKHVNTASAVADVLTQQVWVQKTRATVSAGAGEGALTLRGIVMLGLYLHWPASSQLIPSNAYLFCRGDRTGRPF